MNTYSHIQPHREGSYFSKQFLPWRCQTIKAKQGEKPKELEISAACFEGSPCSDLQLASEEADGREKSWLQILYMDTLYA